MNFFASPKPHIGAGQIVFRRPGHPSAELLFTPALTMLVGMSLLRFGNTNGKQLPQLSDRAEADIRFHAQLPY
jgi:hypothetical protein